MNFSGAFEIGNAIAKLAGAAYQAREKLADDRGVVYLPYRVSVSDHDAGQQMDFYFHVVFIDQYVWYTVSEKSNYYIDHDELLFREREEEDVDPLVRGRSYRRYIFDDCLSSAVEAKVEAVSAGLKKPSRPYLWNTLPLGASFNASEKAFKNAGMLRRRAA